MPDRPHPDGRPPDRLTLLLAQAAVSAIEATGGYAGGVYLRSRTPGLLRLGVLAGLPVRLFRPWWRMHINRPFPVAEAYRSGQAVHLADPEEAMRRFPQLMAGLPFPFGSLYAPVTAGRERFGVLVVLRAATAGGPVAADDRRRLAGAAHRLGTALAELAAGGTRVEWEREPAPVQLPAAGAPPLRVGHFGWDVDTGVVTTDEQFRAILGPAPAPRLADPARPGRRGGVPERPSAAPGAPSGRAAPDTPDRPGGPRRPAGPGAPEGPGGSSPPETPAGAGGPEAPRRPGGPDRPQAPHEPEVPDVPSGVDAPQAPHEPGGPDRLARPGGPHESGGPGAPEVPRGSHEPGGPYVPGEPQASHQSGGPGAPDGPDVPGKPGVPAAPDRPGGPGAAHQSGRPDGPDVPDVPGGPGGPLAPDRPGGPGAPHGLGGRDAPDRPDRRGGPRVGASPAAPDGESATTTMDALLSLLAPADAHGLWTVARQVARAERPVSRAIWLRGRDGWPCLLELSGHRRGPPEDGAPHHLTGVVADPGTGPVAAAAADRLPHGLFSIDRLGRITFVSHGAEALLGHARSRLVGRVLWEALPWFGHPAHEDQFRAGMLSDEPVRFMAHRPPGKWLSVSLHPGHDGLTVMLSEAEQPAYAPESLVAPGAGLGSPADRAAVLYRPVALAIALTEAVTARQVSAVVTDELLPAFGGRQLAIYLLSERHLHLAWETGFPQGFLDRFDGVGLDARLPGVETLTSGRPIFFESMQRLAAAYPGIPLDTHVGARAFLPLIASGRPVGSCILGFDQPRGFSPEERTVLTALAGLIAQALERAQRYDSEAALARGLQDALLPHRLPRLRHVDTVGRYLPGTLGMEVGGDWYDVVETPHGLALVIGDVQGHGVAAAATMGQLRSAVRAFALAGLEPQEVMSGTNRLLIDLDPGQFASCCYIVLDPVAGTTRAVRAGHPQPLLRHPDGRTEVLDLAGGVVLGVDPQAGYPVTALRLEPGGILALFTDGLVEQPGTDIDLGIERLRGTLAEVGTVSLAETADRLIREAGQAADRPDDIALLLAARWAGDRHPEGSPYGTRS
ncbi:SpoIIE family protein phosphatase [Streptomyces sp. HMX112]|uniref:SpoIIE family protein phosphatase n=1 Tax=Streptomyces sp. HMX112 TaxID=3390850 RepID=UPI003A806299